MKSSRVPMIAHSLMLCGGLRLAASATAATVVAWGSSSFGQTNVPVGLSGVTAIAAGELPARSPEQE